MIKMETMSRIVTSFGLDLYGPARWYSGQHRVFAGFESSDEASQWNPMKQDFW